MVLIENITCIRAKNITMENLIDIKGLEDEFSRLDKHIKELYHRFMAIAMDYQYYYDNSWTQKEIYELRDEVTYRLKGVRLQIRILLKHQSTINKSLNQTYKSEPNKILGSYYPDNPLFDQAEEEISSLFDSVLYHLVSIFDYLGNLTHFIFADKNKQQSHSWNSLTKSVRDKKNPYSQKSFAKLIAQIDNDFVNKLYKHRSILIHERGDVFDSRGYTTQKDDIFFCKFVATNKLKKNFSELRKMDKTKFITIEFVMFWLFDKSANYITEILFAMKKEMENTPKVSFPKSIIAMGNGEIKSPSYIYWEGMDPVEYEKIEIEKNTTPNKYVHTHAD